jgi:hypothetical protein
VKDFHHEILIGRNDLKLFKKHYGFDPAVLARIWHDMGKTILLETGNKDKTETGFKVYSGGMLS